MEPIRDPEVLARFGVAFDLYEASVEMMCLNLRRRYPDAGEEEIEQRLADWLLSRPEDPPGSCLRVLSWEEWKAKKRSNSPPAAIEDEGSED